MKKALVLSLSLSIALCGCGDDGQTSGTGGIAGVGGTAGNSGTGGTGGATGTGGTAGEGGRGGGGIIGTGDSAAFRASNMDSFASPIASSSCTGAALNPTIAVLLNGAFTSDGGPGNIYGTTDGYLDIGIALSFDALTFDTVSAGQASVVDCADGPGANQTWTVCSVSAGTTPRQLSIMMKSSGTCGANAAGEFGCFEASGTSMDFDFDVFRLELMDVTLAGQFVGNPPTAISNVVVNGFLSEEAAQTQLPISLGAIFGRPGVAVPIKDLLRGANCPGNDARVTSGGVLGWNTTFQLDMIAVGDTP